MTSQRALQRRIGLEHIPEGIVELALVLERLSPIHLARFLIQVCHSTVSYVELFDAVDEEKGDRHSIREGARVVVPAVRAANDPVAHHRVPEPIDVTTRWLKLTPRLIGTLTPQSDVQKIFVLRNLAH